MAFNRAGEWIPSIEVTEIQLDLADRIAWKFGAWRCRSFEDWEDVKQTCRLLLVKLIADGKEPTDFIPQLGLALKTDLLDHYREFGQVTRQSLKGTREGRVFREIPRVSLDRPVTRYIRGGEDYGQTVADVVPAPPDRKVSFEDTAMLREALAQLSEREREIMVGIYLHDKSMTEIACEQGVTESRISQIHSLALHRMKLLTEAAEKPPEVERVIIPAASAARSREEGDLTERQLQVLQQLANGKTNEEASKTLGVALETIKTHMGHIRRILGGNTNQAIAEGFRRGLLT